LLTLTPGFHLLFNSLYGNLQNKSRQTDSNNLSFRRWQLAAANSFFPSVADQHRTEAVSSFALKTV
jgi:hypothetical protein